MEQSDLISLRVGQLRIWRIGPKDLLLLTRCNDDDVWRFIQSDGFMNYAYGDYLLRHTQLVSEVDNNS
jgi:hypothetical protein